MAESDTVSAALAKVKRARETVHSLTQRRAELEGQRKELVRQLQAEFGVATAEEAVKKLEALDADLEGAQAVLAADLLKLDETIKGLQQ